LELTERQKEVLDAALALLVERGEAPTMNAVADRASCSKETLYKWFGGRDGLLTATVQRQAAKVRAAPVPPEGLDAGRLQASLEDFARDWLLTISGDASVALNRLAVGEAGIEGRALGRIVLEHGPTAMRGRLQPLLEAGRAAGLLAFADPGEAFRTSAWSPATCRSDFCSATRTGRTAPPLIVTPRAPRHNSSPSTGRIVPGPRVGPITD
jgi:AcrR family transcriptional regulator